MLCQVLSIYEFLMLFFFLDVDDVQFFADEGHAAADSALVQVEGFDAGFETFVGLALSD